MSAQAEMWRVTTPEGTFEADLETLKQWIAEGAVIATDKVSKGSLNWIDAGRAPMLRSAFLAKSGNVPAPVTSTQNVEGTEPFVPLANSIAQSGPSYPSSEASNPTASNTCQNHADAPAYYVCRVCAATFCETCPKFVNKVPLCPACGDLCKPFQETRSKVVRQAFQGSGFGFSDFVRALRYPLQHKIALLCGAAIYGFLLLGGLKGQVIAFVIMFGCISHVISQVAWGRLDRSFMPDFSAFSMWDDVAVPIGLGIAITIVSWGPTIVLLVALLFGVFSGAVPSAAQLAQGHDDQKEAPIDQEKLAVLMDPNGDPKKQLEASKELDRLRPGAQISQEAERSKQQLNDPAAGLRLFMTFVQASILFILLLLLSIAWAIFYYPMALAVAGYTQSFGSVINPLVGLDTIRRMGLTYFKAFGMVLVIQVV